MVTAGRDTGSHRFEMAGLVEHLGVYLRIFRLLAERMFAFQSPLVELTDMTALEASLSAAGVSRDDVRQSIRAHQPGGSERFLSEHGIAAELDARHHQLEPAVIAPLRDAFPEAGFRINQRRLEGLGYYNTFGLRISPQAPDGNRYAIVDGGFTDWTAASWETGKSAY